MCGRESIPIDRRRVSANERPSSTSSYSSRPSCTTVTPPAETNRRDGKVGRPCSWGPPSAVSPRAMVLHHVVERRLDAHESLVGVHLDVARDDDVPAADALAGENRLGPAVAT